MGICNSTTKATGPSNTARPTTGNATAVNAPHDGARSSAKARPAFVSRKQEGSRHKAKDNQRNNQRPTPQNARNSSKKPGGAAIPCGKRTDFGYAKDFDARYTIGKLLGHGQFGYTYVAVDQCNGDRVAVKKIEKNKVSFPPLLKIFSTLFYQKLPLPYLAICTFNCSVVLTESFSLVRALESK